MVRDDQFDVASAPAPSQTNSLTILEDGTDFSYFATVTFGSNNKEVQLLLDSGAANTWVMGSDCTTQSCKTHTTYGPSDSSTLKSLDKTFQLTYGSGSVSGELVTDDMSFAGHTISLTFGTASTTSDTFEHYPMDGILGLGRDKSNTAAVGDTFMETVAAAKIIPAKQFGMSLQRESDGSMYGEINFGAPDTSQYDGDLQFTDTVADGHYWEIPCDDVLIDGKSATLTGNTAIIDSGTTYIIMPPADAKQLHASIPGAVAEDDSQWLLPCDIDLDIQFVFSGQKYSISPKDYVGPTVNNMCESHFVGTLAAGPDQWLVGDTFMKNVYTLFDFDQARIGIYLTLKLLREIILKNHRLRCQRQRLSTLLRRPVIALHSSIVLHPIIVIACSPVFGRLFSSCKHDGCSVIHRLVTCVPDHQPIFVCSELGSAYLASEPDLHRNIRRHRLEQFCKRTCFHDSKPGYRRDRRKLRRWEA